MTLTQIIQLFETQNSFSVTRHVSNKQGFDLIQGFFDAFNEYKNIAVETQQKYETFLSGNTFNKVEPEFERIVWNIGWFGERISERVKFFRDVLTDEQRIQSVNYMFEIMDQQAEYTKFMFEPDFELYHRYFSRLDLNIGFHDDDYITFLEFKQNLDEIERLEDAVFRDWVKAQRISGKL